MDMPFGIPEIQTVEQFHLLLLSQLGARLDKKLYALKGGCNLRFFWKSIRYSEDIDFDVKTIARETLRKKVNQILSSKGFADILRSSRTEITHLSESKQTDTTQRWKLHLRVGDSGTDLPTKIEFSRRGFKEGVVFEPVDSEILRTYKLQPILTSHYALEPAFAQKVEALIGRQEIQARDVFDLKLLSERGAKGSALSPATRKKGLGQACENALSISFPEFKAQVVAYLPAEYQSYYGDRSVWNNLQKRVVEILEDL